MIEQVILVDENDQEIGVEEKLKAHEDGKLHRCFSVLITNSKNELMLQRRAKDKYHNGGMWTNTCCSHPRPNEDTEDAARRRLKEEMGFNCELKEVSTFIYKKKFDNGLTEHEFDHLFTGTYEKDPVINPEEADEWKWISVTELKKDLQENPDKYTYWFKIVIDKLYK